MPLPSTPRAATRPVYREVFSQAFKTAWTGWRYWPLAFLASLLLSAGSYDVLLRAVDSISAKSVSFGKNSEAIMSILSSIQTTWNGRIDILSILSGLQILIGIMVVILGALMLSCVAQAGLVYVIGAMKREDRPTLSEAIRVGGKAFWPVVALNALILTTLWILRFLAAFPLYLALEGQTKGYWILYFISFLVFMWLSFMVSVIHIFALNALVLQGTPVAEGIIRGYALFKKHWVVIVETAVLLFLTALAVGAGAVIVSLIAFLPFFAALIAAEAANLSFAFYVVMAVGLAVYALGVAVLSAFLTQLQYGAWTYLYRRIGEGGVVPKLHRWFRAVFGITSIPQN
jgi:hypothetical protein